MTVIELSDEEAAALKAKAAADGLTLEAWLRQLATAEPADRSRHRRGRYSLSELMAQCDPSAPHSAEDRELA